MPEIKNNFLAARMNKDLDDRIIPPGEYRSALNIQVVQSEGSDGGVVQNTLGNTNLTNIPLSPALKSIGGFFDERNNRVFLLVSDNANDHRILMYDINLDTSYTLVSGSFLNFDYDYIVTGINILENLLLWTDNNNQPRRININTAIADPTFYDSEVKISVAKYAPVHSPKVTAVSKNVGINSDDIEEEFVRIGYRYKFIDNEYSVYSPFTSTVFKMEDNIITDEEDIYTTTELSMMVNGINQVTMQIPVPTSTPLTDYEISEIDIIMKKANDSRILVLDTIQVSGATIALNDFDMDGSNEQPAIEYIYKSSKPKYTLPENQLIRVEDKVPVKALAQEVSGNRVMYGNITINQNLPNLDYSVFYSPKSSAIVAHKPMLENQSVKSRRLYQAGIVLSDIHGRSTPVMLSDNSSIYVEAKPEGFDNTVWDGDSLKIIFNAAIPNAYNASTNPLGWYSFKVVVKQLEQEYYNVYTSGAINYGEFSKNSYIKLLGDNVNKVPRDIDASGVDIDGVVPSSTKLWPKVLNVTSSVTNQSDGNLIDVTGVGDQESQGVFNDFFRLPNSKASDILANLADLVGQERLLFNPALAVFETEPFESSIDIYYETPTSGFVSQINDNINSINLEDFSIASGSLTYAVGNVPESTSSKTAIATLYAFQDATLFTEIVGGAATFVLNSGGVNGRYTVELDGTDGYYKVFLNNAFLYDSLDTSRTLNITATFGATEITRNVTITETDVSPTISGPTTSNLDSDIAPGTLPGGGGVSGGFVALFTAVNGSASKSNKEDLTFTIVSATHNGSNVSARFGIVSNYNRTTQTKGTGTLYVASDISTLSAASDIIFTIKASDSQGDSSNIVLTTDIASGGASTAVTYYRASYNEFSSPTEACAVGVGDARWTAVTVYITPGEDPIASNNSAFKIYADSNLTTGADSGWYRNLADSTGQWVKGSPGGWNQLGGCTQ